MTGFTEIRTKHVQRAKYYGCFVLGMLLSIWSMPPQALDIPTYSTADKVVKVAYFPMNRIVLFTLLIVPLLYVGWYFVMDRNFAQRYMNETTNSE